MGSKVHSGRPHRLKATGKRSLAGLWGFGFRIRFAGREALGVKVMETLNPKLAPTVFRAEVHLEG